MRGPSPVAASGGHSSSQCAGLSPSRPLLLRSTGSRRAGSVIVAHGPSCSSARGILPDQGSNPGPLHWQADSQPLRHQGSPKMPVFRTIRQSKYPAVSSTLMSELQPQFVSCSLKQPTNPFSNHFLIWGFDNVFVRVPQRDRTSRLCV